MANPSHVPDGNQPQASDLSVAAGAGSRMPPQRVVVAAAGILLGLSTALASFATSISQFDALATGDHGTVVFWSAHSGWIALPAVLVALAVGCVVRALTADLIRVTSSGMWFGLLGAITLAVECIKERVFLVSAGHVRNVPSLGAALALVACVVLLAWPTIWSQLVLRRTRRALGGHLTAEGGWIDPELTWKEAREAESAAESAADQRRWAAEADGQRPRWDPTRASEPIPALREIVPGSPGDASEPAAPASAPIDTAAAAADPPSAGPSATAGPPPPPAPGPPAASGITLPPPPTGPPAGAAPARVPPGWYTQAHQPELLWWWDGSRWTGHTHPAHSR